MKPLEDRTDEDAAPSDCAAAVIEVLLLGMKAIRSEMRRCRPSGISVPQFRVLAFLKHHPEASLSLVAEHIGLTLPSMSNAVDGLVRRGFIARQPSVQDRRRINLTLTEDGREAFEVAAQAAHCRIADMLSCLEQDELERVGDSMHGLRKAFTAPSGVSEAANPPS